MDARGKFGEHEKCVRVARGAAESNSSISSLCTAVSLFLHHQLDQHISVSLTQRRKPTISLQTKYYQHNYSRTSKKVNNNHVRG